MAALELRILPMYSNEEMIAQFNTTQRTKISSGCYMLGENQWGLVAFIKAGADIKMFYHVRDNIYQQISYDDGEFSRYQRILYAGSVSDIFKLKTRDCFELGPSHVYYDGANINSIAWGDYENRQNLAGTNIHYINYDDFDKSYKIFDNKLNRIIEDTYGVFDAIIRLFRE